MQLHFWGVRGSIPVPLEPAQIQAKIAAVVQRITARDIATVDAKEQFLTALPQWIFNTVGGNTSCIEVTTADNDTLIFDAGTGIRALGKKLAADKQKTIHLLFSHFHWDHMHGLPFFTPAFNPNTELHIYSVFPAAKKVLNAQMSKPNFPVAMNTFTHNLHFHTIKPGIPFMIGNTILNCKKMRHPGNSYAFSVCENGKKTVYATDVELIQSDFNVTDDTFFKNADVLILDSQYTVEDAHAKANWGHSAFTYAVDFAMMWDVKKLFLFHHEPNYDDKKVYSILQSAIWYAEFAGKKNLHIEIAAEGKTVVI